jgi:hypothetical protein
MPDVNYCVTGTASNNAAGLGTVFLTTTGSAFTTTQLVIGSFSVSGSAVDPNNVCVAIFR